MNASITYCGVALSVTFNYLRGYAGDHTDPPEPEQAEIESIKVGGVEIAEMLDEDQLNAIEALILEDVAEDRAEAMAESRRMEREYP